MRELRVEPSNAAFQNAAGMRCNERAAPMITTPRLARPARILEGALTYFGVVFVTGFVLGIFRVLWSLPRFGERNAELMEQPLMLIAVILASQWSVRRTRSALTPIENLAVGLIALSLMIFAELMVVLELRGLSIAEYLRTRDPLSGGVYLLMLGLFALMPWLISRGRAASKGRSDCVKS